MKRFYLAIISLLIALPLFFTSCSNDNTPPVNVMQSFATYMGSQQLATTFQFTTSGDVQRLVTLTAYLKDAERIALDSLCNVGDRVFLTYTFQGQGLIGYNADINLLQISECYTDTVRPLPAANIPPSLSGYSTVSLIRTGEYLDLMFSASKEKTRSFKVMVSEETEDTSMPDVYISTVVSKPEPTYEVRQYASFYMQPLFSKPGIQGIRVHVANDQNPYQTTFEIKL